MSQPITPDAIFELTEVFSPSLSPDGTLLAFIEGTVDREAGKYRTRVMIAALPDADPRAFTNGPSDSTPRFSPSGDEMSFLRPDAEGRKQVWVIPVGEPRQATSLLGGASEYAWSPDSKHIAFTSRVDQDGPLEPDDDAPQVREIHRIRWRDDAFHHVFVVHLGSGDTRQITDGDGNDGAPAWSPDGSRIALVADRRADRDTTHFSDVWVVSKDGGPPEVRSTGLSAVGAVAWSPDGAASWLSATKTPGWRTYGRGASTYSSRVDPLGLLPTGPRCRHSPRRLCNGPTMAASCSRAIAKASRSSARFKPREGPSSLSRAAVSKWSAWSSTPKTARPP